MNRVTLIGHEYNEGIESNLRDFLLSEGKLTNIIEMYPFVNNRFYSKLVFFIKIFSNLNFFKRMIENRIIGIIAGSNSDLIIFFTPAADFFSNHVVRSAKRHSKFVIAWILDSPVNYRNSEFINAEYDCLFISDRGYLENLKGYSRAKLFPLSEGYELQKYSGVPLKRNEEVVLVGSLYPTRIIQLRHLLEAGLKVSVYTNDRKDLRYLTDEFRNSLRVFGPVFGIERFEIFRNALCVLNLQHPSSIDILNYRIFEVISSGGILATNGGITVKRMFESGGAIIFEKDEDLILSIRNLMKNPEICDQQRAIALDIAGRNTLAIRFQEIIHTIENLEV
jgi:hypothetical protein